MERNVTQSSPKAIGSKLKSHTIQSHLTSASFLTMSSREGKSTHLEIILIDIDIGLIFAKRKSRNLMKIINFFINCCCS
jgi:hypothetical protein